MTLWLSFCGADFGALMLLMETFIHIQTARVQRFHSCVILWVYKGDKVHQLWYIVYLFAFGTLCSFLVDCYALNFEGLHAAKPFVLLFRGTFSIRKNIRVTPPIVFYFTYLQNTRNQPRIYHPGDGFTGPVLFCYESHLITSGLFRTTPSIVGVMWMPIGLQCKCA